MRILWVVAVAAALAGPAGAEDTARTISVSGEGHVAMAPDMATVTLGVTTTAATADVALSKNSAQLADVVALLKASGVADLDIQTSGLSVSPQWVQTSASSGTPPKISGFVASNLVRVRVRDLARLGGLLDGLVKSGANTLSGLSFGLAEQGPAEDAARQAAVTDALRKARLMAIAAGVTLGPLMTLEDVGGGPRPQEMMPMAAKASMVPVEGGEVGVDASVRAVFSIAP